MLGKRKSFRVKGTTSVKWSATDMSLQGDGEVINSSVTGVALLIYSDLDVHPGALFFIEPIDKISTTLQNREAKLVWIKKTYEGGIARSQCGFEYVKKSKKEL